MQFLAVHKTDNPCPVGWDCGNPSTFTAEALREIKEIIGKDTNITLFADRFTRYPTETIDDTNVFNYLYC